MSRSSIVAMTVDCGLVQNELLCHIHSKKHQFKKSVYNPEQFLRFRTQKSPEKGDVNSQMPVWWICLHLCCAWSNQVLLASISINVTNVNERKHSEKVMSANNVRKKSFVTTKLPEILKGTEAENLTTEAFILSN